MHMPTFTHLSHVQFAIHRLLNGTGGVSFSFLSPLIRLFVLALCLHVSVCILAYVYVNYTLALSSSHAQFIRRVEQQKKQK